MRLITYGCGNAFDRACFKPVSNTSYIKPVGGLWASPVGCSYGWDVWCRENEFGDLSHSFEFEFDGKMLVIDSFPDLCAIPCIDTSMLPRAERLMLTMCGALIDFEKLFSDGIDAIYLTEKGQAETRHTDPGLYGWDCECVLIMNPDSIKEA